MDETIPLFGHPNQQFDQTEIVIHFFTPPLEGRIRLFATKTNVKGPATSSKVPAHISSSYNRVTTLAQIFPPL